MIPPGAVSSGDVEPDFEAGRVGRLDGAAAVVGEGEVMSVLVKSAEDAVVVDATIAEVVAVGVDVDVEV